MNVDCRWFSAHLEAYFCESLEAGDLQLASEHLTTCVSCRNEVQALQEVDPLIKQLLEYRTTVAQTAARTAAQAPRRSLGFQFGLAAAALALAVVLGFAAFSREARGPESLAPTVESVEKIKDETIAPAERAKPDAPDRKSTAGTPVPEPAIPDDGPQFQVMSPEGYSTSLSDYHGRVLLFGVWSEDQPEAAQNLQRLYQAFGTRHEVRILGVSSRNQTRLAGTTFPMVFNNGSRLLNIRSSNYAVVDKDGNLQMSGSLAGDANSMIPRIKAKLDELAAGK